MGKVRRGSSEIMLFRAKPHDLAHVMRIQYIEVKAREHLDATNTVVFGVLDSQWGGFIERSGKGDRIKILDFKGAGEMLAAEAVFIDGTPVVQARALERCELLCMDAVALKDVSARNVQLMQRLGTAIATAHRFDAQWAAFLAHRSVRERGGRTAPVGKVWCADGPRCSTHIALTHRQIASFVGATREAVSVAIVQLKQENVLEFRGKYAVIHNLDDVQEVLRS